MKKLTLLLLIVPFSGICQTQSYKIKETTPSYLRNGERTYEVENTSSRSTYENPQYVAPPANNTAKYIQDAGKSISNSISNISRNTVARSSNSGILNSEKTSLRSFELNSYKYIVIEKSPYNSARKVVVNLLKKSGYNIVNIHKTSRTHYVNPSDLQENPDLALYLDMEIACPFSCEATIKLYSYSNKLVYNYTGTSGLKGNHALKRALSPLENYGFKYDPNIVRKKPIDPVDSTSVDIENSSKEEAINEIKQLKELLDSGILSQEEFDKKAAELKKIILGN